MAELAAFQVLGPVLAIPLSIKWDDVPGTADLLERLQGVFSGVPSEVIRLLTFEGPVNKIEVGGKESNDSMDAESTSRQFTGDVITGRFEP